MEPLPRAWRNFKRAQDCACVAAILIFAGATVYAWRSLPDAVVAKALVTLVFPAAYAAATIAASLMIPRVRRYLQAYVGASFKAGFGQGPLSILMGLGLLIGAALFLYVEVVNAAAQGRYPAGAFSAYGAGIGVLIAQALLTRRLEQDPAVREVLAGGSGG